MKLAAAFFALVLIVSLLAKDQPEVPVEGEKVTLDPFKVKGTATSNFGIDIQIVKDIETQTILRIRITAVATDSDASEAGLQVGDEIVAIDGVPVLGMDAKIDIASQIGRIFLNRRSGDALNLEVIMRRPQKVTLHANSIRWKGQPIPW